MDPTIAIRATGLSKSYRIWDRPSSRLRASLLESAAKILSEDIAQKLQARAQRHVRIFRALDNVSFELRRGESVGIIGRNGSGKSTLLQLLAGTLRPTSGTVKVNGRVAALLELGSGFNPEFTGRENIYLNGAVLGLSRSFLNSRFEEIAAFADIGDFIDQPVRIYSSGMVVRLAFAVNTCLDPDIMIIDEALAVGDAPFQAKCFRRLHDLLDRGVTLLFVSHDVGTVRSVCSRAIWLDHGTVRLAGDAHHVSREYEKHCWAAQGVQFTSEQPSEPKPESAEAKHAPALIASVPIHTPPLSVPAPSGAEPPAALLEPNPTFEKLAQGSRYGTGAVMISNLLITDANNEPVETVNYGETIWVHHLLEVHTPIDSDVIVGLRIKDLRGAFILSAQDIWRMHRINAQPGTRLYVRLALPTPLTHGDFVLMTSIFGFVDGSARLNGVYDFGRAVLWDVIETAAHFRINQFNDFPLCGPVHHHAESVFITLSDSPVSVSPGAD